MMETEIDRMFQRSRRVNDQQPIREPNRIFDSNFSDSISERRGNSQQSLMAGGS